MLEKQNKIIIVDNIKEQLEILGKSFFENGLGCRTFLYDPTYDEPLKNVRIAFFDINLTEIAVDTAYDSDEDILKHNSSVFNALADAINLYIAKDNGPYVLIFWTANKKVVNAFKLFMQDDERGFKDTASPILIESIDKAEYNIDGSGKNLAETVLEMLNADNRIKFLFDLEDNARIAGENTLNRLYSILPKSDKWGESIQVFENLDKVLSKIAASALGFQHAKENPKKAVYEGLMPVVNYEFLNSESSLDWNQIVKQLNGATKVGDLVSPDNEIQNKVNTFYHIEDFNGHSKDVRGCLLEIDKAVHATLDSFNIADIDVWITKLLAIKEGNATHQARKTSILQNSKLIAVEISAACDYSNKKERINKYILGVLTSNLNSNIELDLNLKSRPEACYHLGGCSFNHNGSNYHIWLNLNYVFGAKPDDPRLGQPLFILKKEIMDMLGNKYASHISRIGITSF
ncbi:hypothetical protein [Edaphocola aurantiacus]|uniref:hypothetical protein n=1 Tax=Edaphocola aurantiacus TaxID=2601682 RepID=UPI001C93812D|nr:hypothetical protein [Edaphocola aurantiacus]